MFSERSGCVKKKVLIILSIIVFILLITFILFIYPRIVHGKDISIIKNKIKLVDNYLVNNTGDINKIKEELSKEVASSKRNNMEKATNNYLNSVINSVSNLISVDEKNRVNYIYSESKLKDTLDDDLKYLNEIKEKITKIKEESNEFKEVNVNNLNDDEKDELLGLFKENFDIDLYYKIIADYDKNIDQYIAELKYLKDNKNTWSKEDNKIIFNKRSNYKEYSDISRVKEHNKFELIKDETSPVITATDITITKGTSLDVKNKVKCEDAVDGKVECKIDGSYDINKTGTYSIKIKATDESNNTSDKTIKVIVKEKEISNKPYYIEVIRNQNIVLVYGLDSNGNYTKLVKTFIASVGKPITKTPLGTFKTSDKASWGWLVGNIYGQYFTRIHGDILFHSVPYEKKNKSTLEWEEYNKLGTPASKGCIRMTVRDVKWIYDNCPRGTTVKIYDGSIPKGVVKPTAQKISADSPNKGWDPTDPDKNNPWRKG